MNIDEYKTVQSMAKKTMDFLQLFIKEGVTEREIKEEAEKYLFDLGVDSFWYYDVGAFVLVGERTTLSLSGSQYQPIDRMVQKQDLVTVDLSPQIKNVWGDYARSFVIENGSVVGVENIKNQQFKDGIKAELWLHQAFKKYINEKKTFEEVFDQMNLLIEQIGFKNLDFNKNLGHSIVKNKKDRIYFEKGNKQKLKEVDLFTFEPHISKNNFLGFKHENIYFFKNGLLEIL